MLPSNDSPSNDSNEPNTNPASAGAARVAAAELRQVETFRIRKGVGGWYLIPEDEQCHPLLAKLFGHLPVEGVEPLHADWEELRRGLDWASLQDGLRLIHGVARDAKLGMRVCGNVKKSPTIQLWRKVALPVVPVRRVFEGLRGDAARHGVTDFREPHERALREVLASKLPFDTGWYSVKKELQSGRIQRTRARGPLTVEVTASMDDWPALVDTAVWSCLGKVLGAGNGLDVLVKLGLDQDAALVWMEEVVQTASQSSMLGAGNSCSDVQTLSARAGFERVVKAMDTLMDRCEAELKLAFDGLVESCERRLAELQATPSGSSSS